MKKGWLKVAIASKQQISFFICGKYNLYFVLGQPQSADLSKGVD